MYMQVLCPAVLSLIFILLIIIIITTKKQSPLWELQQKGSTLEHDVLISAQRLHTFGLVPNGDASSASPS